MVNFGEIIARVEAIGRQGKLVMQKKETIVELWPRVSKRPCDFIYKGPLIGTQVVQNDRITGSKLGRIRGHRCQEEVRCGDSTFQAFESCFFMVAISLLNRKQGQRMK